MLARLKHIIQGSGPEGVRALLSNPSTPWKTLDILYEDPHVERAWVQLNNGYRLYLHRIHPCKKGFYHPHPWPSAIIIVSGQQMMTLGAGSPVGPPPDPAATLELTAGCGYEMVTQNGWHSICPFDGPSLSIMLTGQPWVMPSMQHSAKALNRYLSHEARDGLLDEFRAHFGCT